MQICSWLEVGVKKKEVIETPENHLHVYTCGVHRATLSADVIVEQCSASCKVQPSALDLQMQRRLSSESADVSYCAHIRGREIAWR